MVACLTAASLLAVAQDKTLITVKGKEGSFGRYTSETTITLDLAGQPSTIVVKETTKVTVSKSAADGTLTFEHKTESSEQTFNGQKLPAGDDNTTSTEVVRANGTLVSLKSDSKEPDPNHLDVRIWQAQSPVFSDKPVGVGDKWSHTYSADAATNAPAAEAAFTFQALEDVSGAKCAKILMEYHETTGNPALTSKITLWVELVSGDVVKESYQFEGLPFPGPNGNMAAQAKGTGQRIAGGPLPESGPPASAEPEAKKIEDVTKGCEKLEGVVTLYKKREAGRLTIYMELKKSQLNQPMMLQATASTGTSTQVVSGSPIGDLLFQFEELQPDKITIVVPNIGNRAKTGSPTERAVKRSFADSFLDQFNVEARSKERDSLLIDVSDLFRGDISRLQAAFQGGMSPFGGGGGGSYSLDREKTFVSALKVFPENLVAETVYNLTGGGGPAAGLDGMSGSSTQADPRSIVLKVVYNLFLLKSDDRYTPRAFDPRVGFFTVAYQDFGKVASVDQNVQHILRWNVQKKDPQAALSEPIKPIVFWLDNAIPKEYRQPLRDGILVWNQAFEKLGIKDAIQVKQMPDDADWDPADMRYNTIRWVNSAGDAYAVTLFRVNPITGEIINGDILVDANMVRFLGLEQDVFINPANTATKAQLDPRSCRLVQDGMLQATIGYLADTILGLDNKVSKEAYIDQYLHNVITHEFGHMLGLRHNFEASTELTLSQLGDRGLVEQAQPAASVMDYVPFNLAAIGNKGIDYYGQGIGKYDAWAIQYGYTMYPSQAAESAGLSKLASQCNQPGLAYQTDEAADGYDPYVSRFDLSANPVEYWTKYMGLTRNLIGSLGSRIPTAGQSYYMMTRQLIGLVSTQARSADQLVRFVGGLRRNANFKGDPGEKPPLAPLSAEVQAKALDLACQYGLSAGAFSIPKSYLDKLTGNPNGSELQVTVDGQNSYPVLDLLTGLQSMVLSDLLSATRMSLVANNEFKAKKGEPSMSIGTVFDKTRAAVWSELHTGDPVDAVRRNLQRRYLDILITDVNKTPSGLPADARMWAWENLKTIRAQIVKIRPSVRDRTTGTHYDECLMRIERALNATESLGGSPSRSLQDVLGG